MQEEACNTKFTSSSDYLQVKVQPRRETRAHSCELLSAIAFIDTKRRYTITVRKLRVTLGLRGLDLNDEDDMECINLQGSSSAQ